MTGGVTPVYAAPETFDGWVSRFSDQYSLAICYQELLTGQRPFPGANVRQLILQHLQAVPNVSPLPPGDQAAIAKALAKKPEERHPTCQDMIRLLRDASPLGQASNSPLPPAAPSLRLAQSPERDDGTNSTSTQSAATASIRKLPHDSHAGPTDFLRSVDAAVLQTEPIVGRKAPVEVSGDGALFPSLIVGVGAVGMTVLQKLRENICRRFGSVAEAPHLRLLLLDTDPDAVRTATAGRPGAALTASEVLLAQLNRPSYYLRPRDGKPALESWLNPRMLYRIPRSQVTTGVRALGRLAFCDNYRTIIRRLQMELDASLEPAALQTTAHSPASVCAPTGRASISSPIWPAPPAAASFSIWLTPCEPSFGRWATPSRTWSACCCCRPWTSAALAFCLSATPAPPSRNCDITPRRFHFHRSLP